MGIGEKIAGLAHRNECFLVKHLFKGIKKTLPHHEKLEVEILSFVANKNSGLHASQFEENYCDKEKVYWFWSFHVPFCSKGSCILLYDHEVGHIQNVTIPFGCFLLISAYFSSFPLIKVKHALLLHVLLLLREN